MNRTFSATTSIKKRSAESTFKKRARIESANGEIHELNGAEVFKEAVALGNQGVFAFDKKAMSDGLPDPLYQPLTRDAVAYISGHDELVRNWTKEHADWLRSREEWESKDEHKKYLALRDRFAAGERERGGRFAKRAERDHAYLEWLEANPDLAGWRGGHAKVISLDGRAMARVTKAKPWRQATVKAEEFWKVNPELHALHKQHIEYEREFVRRRRTKRNKWKEGFKQRPTFTMPDAVLHPRWALFNAPQTSPQGYAELRLPEGRAAMGSVKLRLLIDDKSGTKWPDEWVTVAFRADARLAQFIERTETTTFGKGKKKGETKTKKAYLFRDQQLGRDRSAQFGGAKLIFDKIKLNKDGSLKSAIPFLVFAVTIDDLPLTERARAIQWSDTGEITKSGKKRKKKGLPAGLVSVALDLDARGIGFLTRAVSGVPESEWTHDGVKIIQSRNLVVGDLEKTADGQAAWSPGPTLEHIRDHKRQIGRARRLRGRPIKGEESHIRLQSHITNMGEDRFKKAARKIVNEAFRGFNRRTNEAYPAADVLVMEDLKWFNPDATRERGINRMLAHWNRSNLMKFVEQFAKDAGIRHGKYERISAWGTSQTCAKCGAVGKRYRIEREPVTRRPSIRFAKGNEPLPLFACPNPQCRGRSSDRPNRPFTCNADHNASVNLHRRYVLGDKATAAFGALPKDDNVRRQDFERIEALLLPALERLHGLSPTGPDTIF